MGRRCVVQPKLRLLFLLLILNMAEKRTLVLRLEVRLEFVAFGGRDDGLILWSTGPTTVCCRITHTSQASLMLFFKLTTKFEFRSTRFAVFFHAAGVRILF